MEMPQYIYAKTVRELLGVTESELEHMQKYLKVPKKHKRGSRTMYSYKEVEALLVAKGASC